uniref:Uncharacterized protein n=1 Tax=Trichogramma kaykai TaxID=54128 RepID=A0ABD2XFY2_9HYME
MIPRRDQYEGPRAQRVILYTVPPKAASQPTTRFLTLCREYLYILCIRRKNLNLLVIHAICNYIHVLQYEATKSCSSCGAAKRRAIGSTGSRAIYRTTTRTTTSQTFSRAYLYTGVSSERKQNRSSYTSG